MGKNRRQRQILFVLGIIVITIGSVYLLNLVADVFKSDRNAPVGADVPSNPGNDNRPLFKSK